ncbi:hypothetical protein Tco_0179971 [Tanacetum coccineum]
MPDPPPSIAVPPQLEHVELIRDDIETLRASLTSAIQETMTLRTRVGSLDQHDVVTQESLRIARGIITRLEMAELRSQAQETMTTTNQGMSFAEIEQIVTQRVANAIETIAIYKAKTRVARDLIDQVERKKDKVADNASNKRKWEGNHGRSSNQQQNKGHKVIRAYIVGPSNKKGYVRTLPL